MMRSVTFVLAVFLATGAIAEAPQNALRPVARGHVAAVVTEDGTTPLRPLLRPSLAESAVTMPDIPTEEVAVTQNAVATSLRPQVRPASIVQVAMEGHAAHLRGQICGDPDLQGDTLGNISGRGACGVENAVRVKTVAGIRFPSNPTMDCSTAIALKTWVQGAVIPSVGGQGGGISSIRTTSDYACRNRNNQAGEKLSEHAHGRAIDIAGIKLNSGSEITVLRGWGTTEDGKQLRHMWQAACGTFGTVLGPEANSFHRDHFHFDTASYRSGSYCR